MRAVGVLLFLVAASPLFGQGWSTYRGRTYRVNSSGRICNNRNCSMCNQLQATYMQRTTPQLDGISWVEAEKTINESWVPMDPKDVERLMVLVEPRDGMTLYDLGCGDGRILVAAKEMGCQVAGVEINKKTYDVARANLEKTGPENWALVHGDATKYSLAGADVVVVYLNPGVLEKIKWDTMRKGTRIISYQHEIPGMKGTTFRLSGSRFYLYIAK